MEYENVNENKFHEVVSTIKKKIEKHDLNKWRDIVKPEDVSYNTYFDKLIKEENTECDNKDQINEEKLNSENEKNKNNIYEINKDFFDNLDEREKFYFLLHIKETMETSWLLAQKRLEGIKLEENSESVNVQELINYSKKLSDTTCSPPECDNINDKIIHQEYYPNYHFLNFVNIEEIHLSKLFQLQRYSTVCFPPIITVEEDDDSLIIIITSSTPDTTIYYRVNEEIKEQIYDPYNKPKIPKRPKINIYAWSVKQGFTTSRISYFSKTYKEDSSKNLLNNESSLFISDSLKSEKSENENILNKQSSSANVFKNLGFLLSRKKEKKSETSSNEESSLSDEEK